MLVLVSDDVDTMSPTARRLRRVTRACKDHCQRVQFSVVEYEINPAQWTALSERLIREIDPDLDRLRFYFLDAHARRCMKHVGAKPALDLDGPLVE